MFKVLIYVFSLMIWAVPGYTDSHHPQEFLKSITGSKEEGFKIYQHFCANCHATKPVIPLGAPRIGNEQDWSVRIKQGMPILLKHTDEGLNAMPSRGGCFECTDEQLLMAIVAMLPEKEQKRLTNQGEPIKSAQSKN